MKIVGVPAGDGVGPVVGKVPAFTFPPSRMSTNPDLAVKGKSLAESAETVTRPEGTNEI
jgi:hypothetical protein